MFTVFPDHSHRPMPEGSPRQFGFGCIDRLANRIALLVLFPILLPMYLTATIVIAPLYLMFYATHQFIWFSATAVMGVALVSAALAIPAAPLAAGIATTLIGGVFIHLLNERGKQMQQIERNLTWIPSYFEVLD